MKGTLMKKLFVLFLLLFTTDSFSTGISGGTSAPCDNDTLSKYSGTVNAEINWEPNTIGLNWYDGDTKLTVDNSAQSCVYDGTISVPPAPTKPGYTFNGWKVIPVPGGSKRIEYIESTGTQFIDTGFSAPNGFKAQMGFSAKSMNYIYVMGSHNVGEPYGRNYLEIYSNHHLEIGAGGVYRSTYAIQADTRYDIEFSTVRNNVFLTGDNIGYSGETDSSRSEYTISLFGLHMGNIGTSFVGKMYYVKLYDENGTMVRDFIPVLDKNNVACLWDKITGQFFYNGGTGNFIAGPEI